MAKNLLKYILLNRWSAFLHDLFWIPAALAFAYLIRFNFETIPPEYQKSLFLLTAIALPVQGAIFWFFSLYRGLWRFASLPDIVRILKATGIGALCITGIAAFATHLIGIPRSVLVLYPIFLVMGLCLPRIMYRWHKDHRLHLVSREGKRIVIVGAGHAGELLLRDLLHSQEALPVAFVDDDPGKHGREIHGVRVLGSISALNDIVSALNIDEIVIAIPSMTRSELRVIMDQCAAIGIPSKILPSLSELSDAEVGIDLLRPLSVEDLLGRDTVTLDIDAISEYLHKKTVFISGGGGSIGSELCRQVAGLAPHSLIIFEQSEYNLYAIENELCESFPDVRIVAVLGDVKSKERVSRILTGHKPDVIFHAAAYKHVPMLESNPAEGILNNITGTKILADAAVQCGVERFVLISTDKAVNPMNVMGATKRVAELYCQLINTNSSTQFITTRFGNVLGSAGSVVPLFQRQIKAGGPVTVTHPEISRFFMTIPEAVSLILQAGGMGAGGEIFVMDMGEPILIQDLAKQMIRLSRQPGKADIKIRYTGLRPGEKMSEELFHKSEELMPTPHPKLLLSKILPSLDENYFTTELEHLRKAAQAYNGKKIVKHLTNIVSEFQLNAEDCNIEKLECQ